MGAKQSSSNRGCAQDRAKVAGGQKHEIRYEGEKTGASARTSSAR